TDILTFFPMANSALITHWRSVLHSRHNSPPNLKNWYNRTKTIQFVTVLCGQATKVLKTIPAIQINEVISSENAVNSIGHLVDFFLS
ncbi:hypothetical protein NPIL_646811, partial [Nephila pilipes]